MPALSVFFIFKFISVLYRLETSPDTEDTYYNEWYAQLLSEVKSHGRFFRHLYVFGVFNKETESENQRQAQSEEEPGTHSSGIFAIEIPADGKEQGVCYGLVELSRVARTHIHTLENKRPRHVCHLAYYLWIYKISQSYEARSDGRYYGNVVKYLPYTKTFFAHSEPVN